MSEGWWGTGCMQKTGSRTVMGITGGGLERPSRRKGGGGGGV